VNYKLPHYFIIKIIIGNFRIEVHMKRAIIVTGVPSGDKSIFQPIPAHILSSFDYT